MSNYIMHNGQLYSEDELMHWKYITKKRVNGKWRYYYDNKDILGYDKETAYNQASYKYQNAASNLASATADLNLKNGGKVNYKVDTKGNFQVADTTSAVFLSSLHDYSEAGKKYTAAKNEYMKTPLGKTTKLQNAIYLGRRRIRDLFDRIKSMT